jgi:hypothetical protein
MPAILCWFREPAIPHSRKQAATRTDPWSVLVRSTAFWQLLLASAIAAIPIGGFIGHLVPMLMDRGFSIEKAAGFGSVFAVAIGVGRIGIGMLLDRLYPPLTTCATLLLAAAGAGILLLAGSANASFYVLALSISMIGLAQGAEGDYIKFFSLRLFGLPNFPRVVSIMAMTISIGMALGGLVFAKIFDLSGSYISAIAASLIFYALAGSIFACIKMSAHGGVVRP